MSSASSFRGRERARAFRGAVAVLTALGATTAAMVAAPAVTLRAATISPSVLRVCADPNNLPFSNARGEGFENAVAGVLARHMGRRVEYYWQPQRRGFLRTTLQAHRCDVVMSVLSSQTRLRAPHPYYRSTYVFVSQRAKGLDVRSFDDTRLASLRIGIQVTGEDYDNPPGAQALAARGLIDHIRGYPVYGDYSQVAPQRAIIDGVAAGDVDLAVVWGPVAGYFAAHSHVPLRLEPVSGRAGIDRSPFAFDLSVGVRQEDAALARDLDDALRQEAAAISRIVRQFGIPRAA